MRSIRLGIPRAKRILDLGCGTGWVLAEADKEGQPLCFGLDYSLDSIMGNLTNPRLKVPREETGIRFVVGDGTELPFKDRSVNVVIGHVSMPYLDTQQSLAEVYRVLAPGGSFLLTFHSFHYLWSTLWQSIRRLNWKNSAFLMYVGLNGILNHFGLRQRHWINGRFETVNTSAGVARTAAEAGFILVTTEYAPGRIFFTVTGRKLDPLRNGVGPAPSWSVYCDLVSLHPVNHLPAAE